LKTTDRERKEEGRQDLRKAKTEESHSKSHPARQKNPDGLKKEDKKKKKKKKPFLTWKVTSERGRRGKKKLKFTKERKERNLIGSKKRRHLYSEGECRKRFTQMYGKREKSLPTREKGKGKSVLEKLTMSHSYSRGKKVFVSIGPSKRNTSRPLTDGRKKRKRKEN